jgi:hypothetical protein
MQHPTMSQEQENAVGRVDLVTSLRNRLMSSRSKLHTWVEEQKAVCDTLTNRYRADKDTFQDQIHTKSQSLLAFQLERGLTLSDKNEDGDKYYSNSDHNQQQQQQQQQHKDEKEDDEEEAMKESIQRLKEKVNAQMIALEGKFPKRKKHLVAQF